MRYDRKIKYLDYCENGERVRGSGFLKMEVFRGSFQMELTVKGVRCAQEFAGDVFLCGKDREEILGKIQLADGQGEFRHVCQMDSEGDGFIGNTGISCAELTGIRIPLGEGREITCRWETSDPGAKPAVRPVSEREAAGDVGRQPAAEKTAEKSAKPAVEKAIVKPIMEMAARRQEKGSKREAEKESALHRPETAQGIGQEEPRSKEPALHQAEKTGESQDAVPLLENKWLQLCAIYPHINPFQDQREYLSIGPEDFVLFSSESYKAAGNSFMLHGYYNYRHLILAREERRGEVVYYVGVPGNYYEREKQVAIMFGFESFECAQEPAQSSDFGYYMMKVQL